MKKIKSLFVRDYDGNRQVTPVVVPGSEWVQKGQGIATRKWDGTSVAVIDGELYKRYDVKKGREVPANAIPCEPERNEHTGHWPHWVKCDRENPADKYHFEAWDAVGGELPDQTYELVGPKINGNRDGVPAHLFMVHGAQRFENDPPRDFDGLRVWLGQNKIEGIVWHHSDGRMVKIKRKDFGYKW